MTNNQITETDAVRQVTERMDLGEVSVPPVGVLKKLNDRRRQKRQVSLTVAAIAIAGAGYIGVSSLIDSTTELAVTGNGTVEEVVQDSDTDEVKPSVPEPTVARVPPLETLLDPSEFEFESDAMFYAATPDGGALFSGESLNPFFAIEVRKWIQDDGSAAFEMRMNNRRSIDSWQCGTAIGGVLESAGDTDFQFSVGKEPNIEGGNFDVRDTIECDVIASVPLAETFAQPFGLEVNETESSLTIIDAGGNITRFQKWTDPALERPAE